MPIRAIASRGRPPISPHTRTGTPASRACLFTRLEEAKDRRAQPVVAFGQAGIGAVGGEQELGEIVGPDRQEIDSAAAAGRAFRPAKAPPASRRTRRALEAAASVLRAQAICSSNSSRASSYSQGSDTIGNMTRRTLPPEGLEQRTGLRLHQRRAIQRQPERAPSHGRVLCLVADVGQIGEGLVAADIDGTEDDRLVAGRRRAPCE